MSTGVSSRIGRVAEYDALWLAAALWFLAKFLRYAVSALFPTFQAAFGVPNALLGTAFTGMMVVYSALQFPSGALADRLGAVRVVAAGALVAAAGAAVLGLAPVFAVLVGGMLLVGFGTGAHKTVAVELLSRRYPARVGRVLGVFDTVGALGGVAAPAAVVIATDAATWHALFLAGALAGVALAVGSLVRLVDRESVGEAGSNTEGSKASEPSAEGSNADGSDTDKSDAGGAVALRPYLAVLTDRRLAVFVGATICFSFAYNGVVAFLPLYLTEVGLGSETASALYGAVFAASVVQIGTGELSDRVGRLPVIVGVLALAAVALAGLVALGSAGPVALGVVVVAFGLGSHGFRPLRGAYLTAELPEEVAGGGLGLIRTLLMGAGAFAPAIVGIVADAADFGVAFGLLAVVMVLAAVLAGVVALCS